MSLVICPSCGRKTSGILDKCKFCGASLREYQNEGTTERITSGNIEPIEQKVVKFSTLKIVCILFIVVAIVSAGVYFMLRNNPLYKIDSIFPNNRGNDKPDQRLLTFEESRNYVDSSSKSDMKIKLAEDSLERVESRRKDSLRILNGERNEESGSSVNSNDRNGISVDLPSWLPKRGLLAWYPFDNGDPADKSGNQRDGTLFKIDINRCYGNKQNGGNNRYEAPYDTTFSVQTTNDYEHKEKSAIFFTGYLGYIANYNFPTNLIAYSIACWFKVLPTDKFPDGGSIVTLTSVDKNNELSSFGIVNKGQVVYAVHNAFTGNSEPTKDASQSTSRQDKNLSYCKIMPDDPHQQWHFAVSTWDGKYLRTYCDAVLKDSLYLPTSAAFGSKLFIGSAYEKSLDRNCTYYIRAGRATFENENGEPLDYFQGKIDAVAVYNRALSMTEIDAYYMGSKNDSYDNAVAQALNNRLSGSSTAASGSSIASRIVNRTFYSVTANGMNTSITFKSEGNPATGSMILSQLGCNFAYVYKISGTKINVDFYKSDCGRVSQNNILYYNEKEDNIYMYIGGIRFVFSK